LIEYHCLIIDKKFCEENAIDILSLEFQDLIQDEKLFVHFKELVQKIEALDGESNAFTIPEARYALLGFLVLLCNGYIIKNSSGKTPKESSSVRVKSIMLYLQDRIAEPITLDDVSRHIGISKYHLSREFKSYTGKTMFDYLNTIRCTEAKRMLREGYTVSETAAACGFESLSYFSRCFKNYIGERPSKYAKKLV
jgi:AraC-like DNA-binding protein